MDTVDVRTQGRKESAGSILIGPLGVLKRSWVILVVCVGLVVAGRIMSPDFLTVSNIKCVVLHASILGMVAIGVTIVFLIREVDISVGSLMALAAVLAVEMTAAVESLWGIHAIQGGHYLVRGMVFMIVFIFVIGVGVGLLNGLVVTKLKINSLITTLGVLYAARGLAFIVSGGHAVFLTRLGQFKWLGSSSILGLPTPFLLFVVVGGVAIILLRFTVIGKRIYAIGGNETAAKFQGINTDLWKIICFMISGCCAGLATLMYSSYLQSADPLQAQGYELAAIAIVVLGGTTLEGGKGSVTATLGATFLLAFLNNILDLIGLRGWYQQVVLGIVIVVAVMPRYLRGKTI